MHIQRKHFHPIGLMLLFCIMTSYSAQAQSSDYERLARQNDRPAHFIDTIMLPGDQPESVKMTSIFRIAYPFLAFKKSGNRSKGTFASSAGLNLEVFESPRNDLRVNKQVEVDELKSAGRASWQDTAYASTYEQTQSNDETLSGSMQVEIQPGFYSYLLQLKINDEVSGRNSRTQNVRIFPYNEQQNGEIILIKSVDDAQNPSSLTLMNMGENVEYGKDFYAFVHLPNYDAGTTYSYRVDRIDHEEATEFEREKRVSRTFDESENGDHRPSVVKSFTQQPIPAKQLLTNVKPTLVNAPSKELTLQLSGSDTGFAYALIKVPNKSYPNAFYQIQVMADGDDRPVARRYFQSYWSNIPASLLSLDVAIDMLRFIVDKDTIKQINSGSDREREQKFRDFWTKKDPTPDTEFNELQAEYYRRIDYAYEEYSSEQQPGYESDRGKVYIRFGKPDDIKRTFPTNGPTTEVWTYPSRKFVFKATTGFGDFKLVSN